MTKNHNPSQMGVNAQPQLFATQEMPRIRLVGPAALPCAGRFAQQRPPDTIPGNSSSVATIPARRMPSARNVVK